MPCGIRSGTHRLAVEAETSFGVTNAPQTLLGLVAWDLSAPPQRAIIENQGTRQTLGEHAPNIGLNAETGELAFSTYAMGVGSVAADGVSPTPNALTTCLCGVTGEDAVPISNYPVTAATTPTTTVIPVANGAGYIDGEFYAVPIQVDGGTKVHVRPCVYDDGNEELVSLIALPQAPTHTTDRVYGSLQTRLTECPSFSFQGNVLGGSVEDSWEFVGAGAGNVTFNEATPAEAQTLAFTFKVADFESPVADATRTAPTLIHPIVPAAGGVFLIAAKGNTAGKELEYLRVSIETAREYVHNPDSNESLGVQGYYLADQKARITATVRINDTVPTGTTGANWREAFANQQKFNFAFSWGVVAGRLINVAVRDAILMNDPEHIDVDGIACMKLTFGLAVDGTHPHIAFSQS